MVVHKVTTGLYGVNSWWWMLSLSEVKPTFNNNRPLWNYFLVSKCSDPCGFCYKNVLPCLRDRIVRNHSFSPPRKRNYVNIIAICRLLWLLCPIMVTLNFLAFVCCSNGAEVHSECLVSYKTDFTTSEGRRMWLPEQNHSVTWISNHARMNWLYTSTRLHGFLPPGWCGGSWLCWSTDTVLINCMMSHVWRQQSSSPLSEPHLTIKTCSVHRISGGQWKQ